MAVLASDLPSQPSLPRVGWLFRLWLRPVTSNSGDLQLLPPGVVHLPLAMLRNLVGLPEGDSPVQEQPQPGPHGMRPGFYHDKLTLGDGLQLIRRHEGPFCHLEGLAVFSFAPADGAGLYCVTTQGLGKHVSGLAIGREAAKDGAG